ncbi:MAG: acetyl-CoA carboxylase biotin carboxyl carrier protein [Phycisphaerales bacterium]
MIDIRKLKELVRLMVENDLSELDLKDQEETVTIKRGPTGAPVVAVPVAARHAAPAAHGDDGLEAEAPGPALGAARPSPAPGAAPPPPRQSAVASPMVGTFYSSPNPDAGPFITVGSAVGPDTVVCLIEAMKVFNEIKAECAGTVERILVNNGEAVEFGQKLFLVRPSGAQ